MSELQVLHNVTSLLLSVLKSDRTLFILSIKLVLKEFLYNFFSENSPALEEKFPYFNLFFPENQQFVRFADTTTSENDGILPEEKAVLADFEQVIKNEEIDDIGKIDLEPVSGSKITPPISIGSDFEAVQWVNLCLGRICESPSIQTTLTQLWLDALTQYTKSLGIEVSEKL